MSQLTVLDTLIDSESHTTVSRAAAGTLFSCSSNYDSTAAAAETPFMLIRNPLGSGKTIKIYSVMYNPPTSGSVIYRMYIDATITGNGTTLTPVGGRQTGQATAVGLPTKLPTASAFGTLIDATRFTVNNTTFELDFDYGQWVEANHNVLFTTEKSGAGLDTCVDVGWAEEA